MEKILWSSEIKKWQGQEGALKSADLLMRLMHEYPLGWLGRLYLVGTVSRGRGGADLSGWCWYPSWKGCWRWRHVWQCEASVNLWLELMWSVRSKVPVWNKKDKEKWHQGMGWPGRDRDLLILCLLDYLGYCPFSFVPGAWDILLCRWQAECKWPVVRMWLKPFTSLSAFVS